MRGEDELDDWAQIFVAFFACHLVGDFLLQTDFQAENKYGGLGRDPIARRALLSHLSTYLLAFVPALVWLGGELDAWAVAGVAALIWLPHLLIDDGRLVGAYMRTVKRCEQPTQGLAIAVDQSMHGVSLFALALLAAS